ncbi:Mo-dependent nitrogenase C-terminal domain-containing protein [Spirulina subsalsa FACHB-351]|uniref:Mo-dependent nitrogenase C-terminal domain-containing protein n=1 Tax=Spirulina subsalsa FACHB-351 TaxID=234711 RepID=A0ABT3L014_9CYAN|nr:Mo-dependent nitrogenase C-terminal domain-containing protein [Spirulina subsalsa]MCW6034844.1 Mo-dependent nitrogenase C-terminal domain-containing protein [Spirulina subsalsa FACHB-351]
MTFIHNLKTTQSSPSVNQPRELSVDVLSPLRHWLNRFEIRNAAIAQSICRWIPDQCPFARKIVWQGRTLLVIPPLCKLNPLYDELIALRFRALCYLADQPATGVCVEG